MLLLYFFAWVELLLLMEPRAETTFLKPSEIRFSQKEIPSKFSDFGDINQAILHYTLHPRLINTVPPISVSNRNDGEWYTENNRRLYMFRAMEKLGVLQRIQVNWSLKFRLTLEYGVFVGSGIFRPHYKMLRAESIFLSHFLPIPRAMLLKTAKELIDIAVWYLAQITKCIDVKIMSMVPRNKCDAHRHSFQHVVLLFRTVCSMVIFR